MSESLDKAIKQTRNYRESIKDKPGAKHAYFLSREQINALLTQDGQDLAGIRIYLGAETADCGYLTTVVVVACQEDGEDCYKDYNIPSSEKERENAEDDTDSIGTTRPCPTLCSPVNVLNPIE